MIARPIWWPSLFVALFAPGQGATDQVGGSARRIRSGSQAPGQTCLAHVRQKAIDRMPQAQGPHQNTGYSAPPAEAPCRNAATKRQALIARMDRTAARR
jgi:hypothetical protein